MQAYKRLSCVERAFRSLKSIGLKPRPIFHRLEDRVWAHGFSCMLSYYVEWHMRRALAPILFDDHDKASTEAARLNSVSPAQRSAPAERKARTKRTDDRTPAHSFQSLIGDLATLTGNTLVAGSQTLQMLTRPTPLQRRAFELLGVP